VTVDDLINLGGLQPRQASHDWDAAEAHLNTAIPADFRELVDAGGSGLWFRYIRVFAPDPALHAQNLLDSAGVFEDVRYFWEDDPETRPGDLLEKSRLIAWANTEHGEMIFWRVDPGVASENFPIYILDADYERFERFDLTATEFMTGLKDGTLESEILSSTFMDFAHPFQAYPPV
jgi:hypothetical protein